MASSRASVSSIPAAADGFLPASPMPTRTVPPSPSVGCTSRPCTPIRRGGGAVTRSPICHAAPSAQRRSTRDATVDWRKRALVRSAEAVASPTSARRGDRLTVNGHTGRPDQSVALDRDAHLAGPIRVPGGGSDDAWSSAALSRNRIVDVHDIARDEPIEVEGGHGPAVANRFLSPEPQFRAVTGARWRGVRRFERKALSRMCGLPPFRYCRRHPVRGGLA